MYKEHEFDEDLKEFIEENNIDDHIYEETYNKFIREISEIRQVRCASHTLQIVVTNALKFAPLYVDKFRSLVHLLRTPTYSTILRNEAKRNPPIYDCLTDGTALMIC